MVFVLGVVTSGLELWEGKLCAKGLFRKKLWGGTFWRSLQKVITTSCEFVVSWFIQYCPFTFLSSLLG